MVTYYALFSELISNSLEVGPCITWSPEGFFSFTSALAPAADSASADAAFETLLWGLAQSGVSLLDEKTLASVFGGVIDQATLSMTEQREIYEKTIAQKYGEPPENLLERLAPSNRPLAAIQLANEMLQVAERMRKEAEKRATGEAKRATVAERKLKELDRFRNKQEARKAKAQKRARKSKAEKSRGKKRRRKK
jgi:hypothetical protein